MDKKVPYFARYIPAYRIPILNQLNEALGGNLVVCAGSLPNQSSVLKASAEQNEEYEKIYLQNHFWRGDKIHFQNYRPAFKKYPDPEVILAEESPRSITLPFLLREARIRGAGRVLWGMFSSSNRPYSKRHPLQRYRLKLARSVEACACYSNGIRERLIDSVDDSKLFVAQNTLDTDTLFTLFDDLNAEGRDVVRERHQIPVEDAVIVFTGQLTREKGTRELLEVYQRIQADRKATLIVIGDGPELVPMKDFVASNQLESVRFLGQMPILEESAPFIFASDVMLIPGKVGLAVNHAFCLGVPLITQTAPGGARFHGPEFEFITTGKNGIIASRNISALEQSVIDLLGDRGRFSLDAINYARKNLTSQRMVSGLVSAIQHANNTRSTSR